MRATTRLDDGLADEAVRLTSRHGATRATFVKETLREPPARGRNTSPGPRTRLTRTGERAFFPASISTIRRPCSTSWKTSVDPSVPRRRGGRRDPRCSKARPARGIPPIPPRRVRAPHRRGTETLRVRRTHRLPPDPARRGAPRHRRAGAGRDAGLLSPRSSGGRAGSGHGAVRRCAAVGRRRAAQPREVQPDPRSGHRQPRGAGRARGAQPRDLPTTWRRSVCTTPGPVSQIACSIGGNVRRTRAASTA